MKLSEILVEVSEFRNVCSLLSISIATCSDSTHKVKQLLINAAYYTDLLS